LKGALNAEPGGGTDAVTVIEHGQFAVSDGRGDIRPASYDGLYAADTRYLSQFALRLGGKQLDGLSVAIVDHRHAIFSLTNTASPGLPMTSLIVTRDRNMGASLVESIGVVSYAMHPVKLRLDIELAADFADIFEVRGGGELTRRVTVETLAHGIHFAYENGAARRTTTVVCDHPFTWRNGRMVFRLALEHGVPWAVTVRVEHGEALASVLPRLVPRREIDPDRVARWARSVPHLESDDSRLTRTWRTAVRDLASLLLAEPGGGFIPAAGIPWFMTIYGRDACITAMQSLITGPDVAAGTLRELATLQGKEEDAFRDEEPGKMPHEIRRGELAALGHIPHARHYGAVDPTLLYVMLFAEACKWSGWLGAASGDGGHPPMPARLRRILPAVERALAWIDRDGLRRDMLIWYQRRQRTGMRNQAWKDSADSYRFADGRMASTPIAPLEVQGYVVAAWHGMADVFEALDRQADARRLRAAADVMIRRIDQAFWMPEAGTYAMGLDRAGRQIDSVTSNPGHLLWAGAVSSQRAAAVAERLTAPDMFTGWGIRTMSSEMRAYNPLSYHNGSIWPHDNGLFMAGLARYGEAKRALQIVDALLGAAVRDPKARLPELFGGFDRSATHDLVRYPVACAPQAWATGTIFLIAQTLLGLRPNGGRPTVGPISGGPHVRLSRVRVGTWRGDLEN
jgi:glycogen debranching enzyme